MPKSMEICLFWSWWAPRSRCPRFWKPSISWVSMNPMHPMYQLISVVSLSWSIQYCELYKWCTYRTGISIYYVYINICFLYIEWYLSKIHNYINLYWYCLFINIYQYQYHQISSSVDHCHHMSSSSRPDVQDRWLPKVGAARRHHLLSSGLLHTDLEISLTLYVTYMFDQTNNHEIY